jgi:hypothetical protein
MRECDEHMECIKEKIADYRHLQTVGLVFISIGIATIGSLGIYGFPIAYSAIILITFGAVLFSFSGSRKAEEKRRLCELFKASEPKASERKKSFIEDNSIQP